MTGQPNILLVMADQWRADALSAAGHPLIRTPAIDELAAYGVRFTNAFTPSPICTPARASLYTALYPHAHGAIVNEIEPDRALRLLPEYLSDVGYRTFHAGKWHVGTTDRDAWGFDETVSAHGDYHRFLHQKGIEWSTALSTARLMASPYQPHAGLFPYGVENTRPHFLVDETIRFIEQAQEPYFAVCSFYEPHAPYEIPEPYYSLYDPDAIDLPSSFYEDAADKPEVLRAWDPGKWSRDWPEDKWRRVMAAYYGSLTLIDDQIRRLLEAIDDNTIVLFLADHGEMNGSHRYLYKGPYFFDEVLRIPLVIRLPYAPQQGVECDALVSLLDVFPTLLEFAGAPALDGSHGQSLRPLLEGSQAHGRDYIYSELYDFPYGRTPLWLPMRCYRDDAWKYVERLPVGSGNDELYHLADDPAESRNLANDPAFAEVKQAYRTKLRDVAASLDDPWPEIKERVSFRPR